MRSAIVFSGLMVDRPGAATVRFPASKVAAASKAISRSLAHLKGDVAVVSGACGGDLLFATAAIRLGMPVEMLLPFTPDRFIEESVAPGGPSWVARFRQVIDDPLVAVRTLETAAHPYEAVNQELISTATKQAETAHVVMLWDGAAGRGRGGTADMAARAEQASLETTIIDIQDVPATTLLARLRSHGPKRLLALDGGGIRGALTLGFLDEIQRILRERHRQPDLELRDYFDFIGGTSTGSLVASGLARGIPIEMLLDIYRRMGPEVFGKRRRGILKARSLLKASGLEAQLDHFCGDMTLDDAEITTGLCIVAKRADTGSLWPLLNHPDAKYFEQNRSIRLAAALRASTAAPGFFVPIAVDVGDGEVGAFVDGAVSTAKNPALLMFLIATLDGYPFGWPVGDTQLMLVSLGTGAWTDRVRPEAVVKRKLWNWAADVPRMMMDDSGALNETVLQSLSHSATARVIDSEVGDLRDDLLPAEPLLSYLRYDAELSAEGLERIGLSYLAPRAESLRDMTNADNVDDLAAVGRATAQTFMRPDHFPTGFDVEPMVGGDR